MLKIPTQAQIVAFLSPAPVLQEPATDPIGLMTQQLKLWMLCQQPQRSGQAAAAARCWATLRYELLELCCLFWAGLGIEQRWA